MADIRDAKFYVCEDAAKFHHDRRPLDFDTALRQATEMAGHGRRAREVHGRCQPVAVDTIGECRHSRWAGADRIAPRSQCAVANPLSVAATFASS